MRLFNPGPRNPNLTISDVLENAQWHATNRENWVPDIRAAEMTVHSGSAQAAVERKHMYLDAEFNYPIAPKSLPESEHVYEDVEANLADATYLRKKGMQPSDAVKDSIGFPHTVAPRAAVTALEEGHSVPYRNEAEDRGSTSYVSPPGGFSTLADADLGLARNWSPRPYFTDSEMRSQGFLAPYREIPTVENDPRLFEERSPGEYYPPSSVAPHAMRSRERISRYDITGPEL
jgi:hypothetical protein